MGMFHTECNREGTRTVLCKLRGLLPLCEHSYRGWVPRNNHESALEHRLDLEESIFILKHMYIEVKMRNPYTFER